MKRRTNAEIREVQDIHDRTSDLVRQIEARVHPDQDNDPTYLQISIRAASYWHNRAEYQREVADTMIVSFSSKDPEEIERVARAIKAALQRR